jgi:dTDP-glucose 4,6-dehydratase
VNTDWEIVCLSSFHHRGITDRIRYSISDIPNSDKRVKVLIHDLVAPISPVLDYEIGSINYVFNVASDSHVDRSITEPASFIQNNVALICNMLDWAKNRDIEKFIQVSTDEVYGPAPHGHKHKEWEPFYPSNPYSASKAAQESVAFSYWRTYGVPVVITNTMNIVGEMQDPEKYVPMIIKKVLAGDTVKIHASPTGEIGSRYYLHARNQADALLHVANNIDAPLYGQSEVPEKLHVVGEREVDNLELALMVAEYVGKPLNYELIDFHSSRPGHDLRYALDGDKIAGTGWKSPLSLEESLERTVRWTLKHQEWLNL